MILAAAGHKPELRYLRSDPEWPFLRTFSPSAVSAWPSDSWDTADSYARGSDLDTESLFQGCGKKKSTRHLLQPAQENFLPCVSTTFSPICRGSRECRTDTSLKAAVQGEEERHNCFLALAHLLLESPPSASCLQAQWGTGGMVCLFASVTSWKPCTGIGNHCPTTNQQCYL